MNTRPKLALIATVVFIAAVGLTNFNLSFGHPGYGGDMHVFLAGQRRSFWAAFRVELALLLISFALIWLWPRRRN